MTKELIMDTDALKATMARLENGDRELAFPRTVAARKARHGVDALARWQVVQIGAGIVIALAGGTVWSDLLARPGLLFASGLLTNLFGVAMIALGVAGLTRAVRIDVAAPIVETEGHMARLHQIKLASGWMLGASWWVLWLPFAAVAVRLLWGADMLAPIGISEWRILLSLNPDRRAKLADHQSDPPPAGAERLMVRASSITSWAIGWRLW